MKKVLIIVLAVILAAGGGALWFFVLRDTSPVYYSPGEYFVTNVQDSNSFFKVSIVLEVERDKKLLETLEADNVQIRDSIIFTLRSYTVDELRTPGIEDDLRLRIVDELNWLFDTDKIIYAHFNDFVVQ